MDGQAFLFPAIILFGVSLVWVFHVVRSRKWLQTQGVITVSNVKVNFGGRTMSRYHEVAFKYSVDGQEYIGSNKMPGSMGKFEWTIGGLFGSADNEKKELPVGKEVTVYYNPGNPKDSALALGNSVTPLLFTAISFVFLLWALQNTLVNG